MDADMEASQMSGHGRKKRDELVLVFFVGHAFWFGGKTLSHEFHRIPSDGPNRYSLRIHILFEKVMCSTLLCRFGGSMESSCTEPEVFVRLDPFQTLSDAHIQTHL